MDEREIQQLTEEARDAVDSGNYVRAVAITDQLTTVVPDDPLVCALRAEALLRTDAVAESLSAARRAVELAPQEPRLHTVLGLAAWRAEKLTLAQQSLERAVELSGEEPGVVAEFAFFMAAARGPRLAEAAANEALATDPECAAAWAARGLAQFRLRRRRAAEASLTRALELDPDDPYAQAAMLALLYDRRDAARAVALAELLRDSHGEEQFIAVRLFLRRSGLPDISSTRQFVETIQDEAKQRQVGRELVERGALREPTYYAGSLGQLWLCLVFSAVIVAGLVVLIALRPDLAPIIILFGLIPLFLVWMARRLFE
jgi:Tfp pilus assembly protein PilF